MNNNTLTLSKAITRDGKPVIDITLREQIGRASCRERV